MEKKHTSKATKKAKKKMLVVEEEKLSPSIPSSIFAKQDFIYLLINAKPNSKRNAITNIDDEGIGLSISAPPKDGLANSAIIEFLSQILEVKKSHISLGKGSKSRSKTFLIENQAQEYNAEQFYKKFKENSS